MRPVGRSSPTAAVVLVPRAEEEEERGTAVETKKRQDLRPASFVENRGLDCA